MNKTECARISYAVNDFMYTYIYDLYIIYLPIQIQKFVEYLKFWMTP